MIMPAAKSVSLDLFLDPLNKAMTEFGINTPIQQAMFLAQIAHESGQLRWVKEIWGPTTQQRRYESPSELAKKLGNTAVGDGWRFAGRGLIQITGRHNYATYGAGLGLDCVTNPELLEMPVHAARVSALFWQRNDLNDFADDIVKCTKHINGGLNGLEDRKAFYLVAKEVLSA
jgi:putative chitinase